MNDRIQIRLCGDGDVNTLKELWSVCFTEDSSEDIDAFFKLVYPLSTALGGFDGDTAVVMLYLLPAFAGNANRRIPVWYLYAGGTHPLFRSRGLYSRLMAAAREWATDSECHAIYLHPADPGLYALYSSLGYTRELVSTMPTYPKRNLRSVPRDVYFAKRIETAQNLLIWEPTEPITDLFFKNEWSPSVDESGTMYLMNGKDSIEQLPLTLSASSSVTTALWLPTTRDCAILDSLESTAGYSLIYGD